MELSRKKPSASPYVHDDATQLLAVVHIALADLADDLPAAMGARVQEVRGQFGPNRNATIERISMNCVRPYWTTWADAALEFLAERNNQAHDAGDRHEGSTNGRLASSVETTLYRMFKKPWLTRPSMLTPAVPWCK